MIKLSPAIAKRIYDRWRLGSEPYKLHLYQIEPSSFIWPQVKLLRMDQRDDARYFKVLKRSYLVEAEAIKHFRTWSHDQTSTNT